MVLRDKLGKFKSYRSSERINFCVLGRRYKSARAWIGLIVMFALSRFTSRTLGDQSNMENQLVV